MKRMVTAVAVLVVFLAICFCGCSAQKDIVITDCSSGQTIAGFSLKEDQNTAALLTNALNNGEVVSAQIDYSQKYLIHFVDPKDSLYDIWYYLYVNEDKNEVYVQFDLTEMKTYNDKTNGFFDDSIRRSTNLTAEEFLTILSTD